MSQWNPDDYHQHSSQQQKWATEVLVKLHLKGHERILDLGCGDGKVTAEIARAVPQGRVVGLDSSTQMIEFARKNFPPSRHLNLQFQLGDARSLDLDNEFDWVVSFACLHWVIDHRPVLAGVARSLCVGGRVMLQFGGEGNAAEIVQVVAHIISRPEWASRFEGMEFPWGFYSPDHYRPWLQEAGMAATRLELIPKDMTHQGREGLAGWLRTTWLPYLQRLPEPSQQPFLDQIIDEYLKTQPMDDHGLVHLSMVRLEVEAVKPYAVAS